MASSDHNSNDLTFSEDGHNHQLVQPTLKPRTHDHRRKAASSSKGKERKKKQPQRGMGVAQLERLRIEERWKKMTEINNIQSPQSYAVIPTSLNTVPMQLANKLGVYSLNLNQPAMLVQRVASNGTTSIGLISGQANQYGFGVGVGNETSSKKELSSTPNLIMNGYPNHCTVCYRKKRNVGGENLAFKGSLTDINATAMPSLTSSTFVGLYDGNGPNYNIGTNQDFGKKASTFHAGSFSVGGTICEGVELVAVHRKASSSAGGESERLLMEYNFFPSGKDGSRINCHESDQNDVMMQIMMIKEKLDGSESSSSVPAAAAMGYHGDASCASTTTTITNGDGAVADGSNSIDLSLRLSY